ncbi:MAG: PD-(D/E)XK nuclease family protein [Candidatus Woesearchaeota archaeon]
MKVFSHSRIQSYEQCPLKFKFAYIDNVETEISESIESFLGSRVHEALEKLYRDLMFEKLDSVEEILQFYNEEWKKNWNDGIVIVRENEGYSAENYRKMGERFLRDYYKRYYPFNHSRTIALETEEKVALDDEHYIHIRIDRLAIAPDGTYEIHDYKTSSSIKTQEELDKDRQLAIYAYGVKKMFPDAKKVSLVWHYLAFDKEMRSERTDEQLEKLRDEVLSIIREIESEDKFEPKMSALCDWCEFRPVCPNFKHLYELEKKEPEEFLDDEGVKLVNEYAAISERIEELSERAEELKEKIKRFAIQKNVNFVYGSEVKALVKVYSRLNFPGRDNPKRKELFELLKKVGLWEQIAEPNFYELSKLLNSGEIHPEIKGLIEKYVEKCDTVFLRLMKK